MSNFEARVTLPGSENPNVIVTADVGTQMIGQLTGQPLDATDPGPITLYVFDGVGATEIIFNDPVFAAAVRDALDRALKVCDTRDYSLDKPRTDS